MQLVLMAALMAALVYIVAMGVADSRVHRAPRRRIEAFKLTRLEDSYPAASPIRPPLGLTLDDYEVVQSAY